MAGKKQSRWHALSRFERQGPFHATGRLTRSFVEGLGQAFGFSDSAGFEAVLVVAAMAIAGLLAAIVLGVALTVAWIALLPIFAVGIAAERLSGRR